MRAPHRAIVALLLLLTISHATPVHLLAQRAGGRVQLPSRTASGAVVGAPRWSFWLQQSWAAAELAALLFAAYQLWARRSERRLAEAETKAVALKAANYQAWQVVNSAQGKGGSGGRIDALQDLNRNRISLAGVRLDGAWLTGIRLPEAQLTNASLREANLTGADLRGANLDSADLTGVILTGADLRGAFLKNAIVTRAQLATADWRDTDLQGLVDWSAIGGVRYLNIEGVRHAPPGFREWALNGGAVEGEATLVPDAERDFSKEFRTV